MDFRLGPEQEAWRLEVSEFLDKELPRVYAFDTDFEERDEMWEFAIQFSKKVSDKGWIALTWPREYGGSERSLLDWAILMGEFGARGAPLVNAIGWGLASNTLLKFGTDEQKKTHLPAIAKTETIWAEGLSEPNAGSDLASLETRATRDGDRWIVNGQKTYQTWAHRADVLYLAARTDPAVPKHSGISVFYLDLSTPGVRLTPQNNLGGGRQNHIFLDDVQIPADRLLGEEGQGWQYIMDRFYGGRAWGTGKFNRIYTNLVEYCKTTQRDGQLLSKDPVVRLKLAEMAADLECLKLLDFETLWGIEHGLSPKYGGAIIPVVHKEFGPRFADAMMDILGPLAQIEGEDGPGDGQFERFYRQSFSNHSGGTPQVKRMVLATRGLGLPR